LAGAVDRTEIENVQTIAVRRYTMIL